MNWSAWAPAIITVIGWIFTMGMTVGRIKDQEKTLVNHDGRLTSHDRRLADVEKSQARSEGWQAGFNAGKTDKED